MSEEVDKMSFEDSMKTLEDLVKQLESGELDLDKSLEVYDRAVVLRDHCKKILDESDSKVQTIMETASGIVNKDFQVNE